MSLALLVGGAASMGAAGADSACQVSSFSRKPLWTSAGFWNSSDLVVLDPVQRGLLRYGGDGQARRDVSGQSTKSLSDLHPVGVALRSDGQTGDGKIIIQTEFNQFNRFLLLSPDYTFDGSVVDILSRPTTEGSSIERIYTWAPTWSPTQKQNGVVAFADLKKGVQWSTGVVRFSLDDNSAGRFLKNLSVNDVSRKFHRLGYPYIASIQEDAYVLLMEDGFRLWKSDPAGNFTELATFHESFPKTPVLPAFVRPTDYAAIMSEVEEAEMMPTGLVAWENKLYVVWRTPPHAGSGTDWFVGEVDRNNGKVISQAVIPSHANHLFAVPGKGNWAFVEKGPALGLRDQEVRNVITVSSQKLRSVMKASSEQKRSGSQVALKLCE